MKRSIQEQLRQYGARKPLRLLWYSAGGGFLIALILVAVVNA